MKFRVVHSEPRRAVLSHQDESVKATLEITDHDGASLSDFFPEGKFLEVEINDILEEVEQTREQLAAEASTLTVEERMALHHAEGERIEVTINQVIHDADDPDRVYAATKKAIADLMPPGAAPAGGAAIDDSAKDPITGQADMAASCTAPYVSPVSLPGAAKTIEFLQDKIREHAAPAAPSPHDTDVPPDRE